MRDAPTPFEIGASLARISVTSTGFKIDCRGPWDARQHFFNTAVEAAEAAVVLRNRYGWALRFHPGAEVVLVDVTMIDPENAP